MRNLLLGVLATASITASANVCQVQAVYDTYHDQVKLYLNDSEALYGDFRETSKVNPKRLSCSDLIKDIKTSGTKTFEVEGQEIPIKLYLIQAIDL